MLEATALPNAQALAAHILTTGQHRYPAETEEDRRARLIGQARPSHTTDTPGGRSGWRSEPGTLFPPGDIVIFTGAQKATLEREAAKWHEIGIDLLGEEDNNDE